MVEILIGLIPVLLAVAWREAYLAGRRSHQRMIEERVRKMLLHDVKISEGGKIDPYEAEIRHSHHYPGPAHDWRTGFKVTVAS